MRTTVLATIIIGIFLIGNVTNSHAGEAYLFIDGIPGEATEPRHRGWLKINSFSWGFERPLSSGSKSGGRTAPRTEMQGLNVSMNLDSSFPKLALNGPLGKIIPKVILEEVHPKTKLPILKMTFHIVNLSGMQLGSSSKQVTTVNLSFDYRRIEWNYTVKDPRTGKTKGDIRAHWDLRSNKGG